MATCGRDAVDVDPETEYVFSVYARGELDPDDSHGQWLVRARFYDSQEAEISYQDIISGAAGTLSTYWQQKSNDGFDTPAGAATLRIELYNYMNTGWVAYDDLVLEISNIEGRQGQGIEGTNLVINPGFESGAWGWTEVGDSDFPATSFYRSTWGTTAAPHGGSYAYAISNHTYGHLESSPINVFPSANYDLRAYVRGELDAEDSHGNWEIRAYFYRHHRHPHQLRYRRFGRRRQSEHHLAAGGRAGDRTR